MNILVSGAAGLIGSHCVEYFTQAGHRVLAIDNLLRSKIFGVSSKSVEYNWEFLKTLKRVQCIKEDIRHFDALLKITKQFKPDCVIHTAGQTGVKFSLNHPKEDCDINAVGTLNLLESLRKVNPKGIFIYCSTNKVYGDHVNQVPLSLSRWRYDFKSIKGINESFSIDQTGHTPYGISKLAGDLYTQDYGHIFGLKCAVFRMSCIYGTRQFGFEDQGWLAWFALNCFLEKPVTIFGDGRQVRDVLWVKDLVGAFSAFIDQATLGPKKIVGTMVVNMGGGLKRSLSLLELIDLLERISGLKMKVNFAPWRASDQKVYISDISKAKRLLNWQPKVSVKEGVSSLYQWIKTYASVMKGLKK